MVFTPLTFLLKYRDGGLHEWHFRAHLDHYMALLGMVGAIDCLGNEILELNALLCAVGVQLCAFYHPTVSRWLERVEKMGRWKLRAIKWSLCLATVPLLATYVQRYLFAECKDILPSVCLDGGR